MTVLSKSSFKRMILVVMTLTLLVATHVLVPERRLTVQAFNPRTFPVITRTLGGQQPFAPFNLAKTWKASPNPTTSNRLLGRTTAAASAATSLTPGKQQTSSSSSWRDNLSAQESAARKRRLAAGLAFLTGLADYVYLYQVGAFATMLTGNYIKIGQALLVQRKVTTALYFVALFFSYCTGLAVMRMTRHAPPKRILQGTAAAVAFLFGTADVCFYQATGLAWAKPLAVCCMAMAFGCINSIGTDFAGTMTFVVTGHFTKLTHLVTDRWWEGKRWNAADIALAKQSLAVSLGFLGGALLAAALQVRQLLFRPGIWTAVGLGYASLLLGYEGARIKQWWKRRKIPEMAVIQVMVNDEPLMTVSAENATEAAQAALGNLTEFPLESSGLMTTTTTTAPEEES